MVNMSPVATPNSGENMPTERRQSKPKTFTDLIHLAERVLPVKPLSFDIEADDLLDRLDDPDKTSALFLGHYSMAMVENALERYGVYEKLRKKGYGDIKLRIDMRSGFESHLALYDSVLDDEMLLGEVVIHRGVYQPKDDSPARNRLDELSLLTIHWILMQDIRGGFTDKRPRLPGQNHPGLGIGRDVVEMLIGLGNRLEQDGLLNRPEYFHNACFYAYKFKFVDPAKQGELMALERDLAARHSVAACSYAAYFHAIEDSMSGEPYRWVPADQILPISEKTREYFESEWYKRAVEDRSRALSFEIDRSLLDEHMKDAESLTW